MHKPTTITILLSTALLGSNIIWAWAWINNLITIQYYHSYWLQTKNSLDQAIFLLPKASQIDSTPLGLINALTEFSDKKLQYEKDGYVYVGSLGLQFNKNGRISRVISIMDEEPADSNYSANPAHPPDHSNH